MDSKPDTFKQVVKLETKMKSLKKQNESLLDIVKELKQELQPKSSLPVSVPFKLLQPRKITDKYTQTDLTIPKQFTIEEFEEGTRYSFILPKTIEENISRIVHDVALPNNNVSLRNEEQCQCLTPNLDTHIEENISDLKKKDKATSISNEIAKLANAICSDVDNLIIDEEGSDITNQANITDDGQKTAEKNNATFNVDKTGVGGNDAMKDIYGSSENYKTFVSKIYTSIEKLFKSGIFSKKTTKLHIISILFDYIIVLCIEECECKKSNTKDYNTEEFNNKVLNTKDSNTNNVNTEVTKESNTNNLNTKVLNTKDSNIDILNTKILNTKDSNTNGLNTKILNTKNSNTNDLNTNILTTKDCNTSVSKVLNTKNCNTNDLNTKVLNVKDCNTNTLNIEVLNTKEHNTNDLNNKVVNAKESNANDNNNKDQVNNQETSTEVPTKKRRTISEIELHLQTMKQERSDDEDETTELSDAIAAEMELESENQIETLQREIFNRGTQQPEQHQQLIQQQQQKHDEKQQQQAKQQQKPQQIKSITYDPYLNMFMTQNPNSNNILADTRPPGPPPCPPPCPPPGPPPRPPPTPVPTLPQTQTQTYTHNYYTNQDSIKNYRIPYKRYNSNRPNTPYQRQQPITKVPTSQPSHAQPTYTYPQYYQQNIQMQGHMSGMYPQNTPYH